MDFTLHIKTDFEAVYLLNGLFTDNAAAVRHSSDSAAYITVLPLSAMLLPYTVKLSGNRVASNQELCRLVFLDNNKLLLHLLPRHNYVYSAAKPPAPRLKSAAAALFDAVKAGRMTDARALLTPELSSSVTDTALTHFFEPYNAIYLNDGYVIAPENSYILALQDGRGEVFVFALKSGLIDNIVETSF